MLRRIVLAAAAAAAFACPAFAMDFQVVNSSDTTIKSLFLALSDSDAWGPDQLGSGKSDVIEPGSKFTLTGIEEGTYDIRIVAADDRECTAEDVEFDEGKMIELTEGLLDGCATN